MSEKHKTVGDLLRSVGVDDDGVREFESETYDQLLQWCSDLYHAGELLYDELSAVDEIYETEESSEGILAWEEARKLKDIRGRDS